jgi:3-hydroxybutyryl-CoA dehydrogenase
MAAGIAEAIIVSGRSVRILPPRQSGYARMTSVLSRSLARSVEKGRFTQEQANASLARLQFVDAVQQLSDVDLVIEAVKEDLQVKRAFFARLDNQLPPSTILATNTSSFRVADISAGLPKTRRLIALHFFNPAQAMKLVEVVVPPAFSEITGDICAWVRDLNKVPVICADTRGFIVNRLLLPFLNDAGLAHDSGILISEIEREMTEVAHHPMGPFALMDLIGLDVMASALDTLAEGERDPRMKPARSLRERIDTGALGRKSRAGFHQYGEAK